MPPTSSTPQDTASELADKLVSYLETNTVPEGLFTPDVFLDFTTPLWRTQSVGIEDAIAPRKIGHPGPGRVPRSRMDVTPTGFVLEVEEEWDSYGESWYCRELIRADIADSSICEMSVYCTGDWDRARVARHAAEVQLIRP